MRTLKIAPRYLFLSSLYCLINVSTSGFPVLSAEEQNKASSPALVTVFIHGIMSIKPHVSVNNFIRFLEDDVDNTIYSKSIEYMRQNDFFYQNQPMQQIGLVEIDPDRIEPGYASGAMAHLFETLEAHLPHNNKQKRYYYTFGWSGLLSAKNRCNEAKKLFEALHKLNKDLRENNIIPAFRLIAYSHGGNVALNLANVRRKTKKSTDLTIQELIMLGTPVQPQTDYLINDPMFKNIYHIFSTKDRVQTIDFISSQCLFSDNTFRPKKGCKLPESLVQIEVQVKRPTLQVKKNPKKLKAASDLSNRAIVLGRSRLLRDASPGHAELWFFGWTPMHYRPNFPLCPLSIVAFLPIILHEVNKMRSNIKPNCPIILDFRPEQLAMIMRSHNTFPPYHIVTLMSQKKYQEIIDTTLQYKPANYTATAYEGEIKKAVDKAKEFYKVNEESRRKKQIRRGTKKYLPAKNWSYLRDISWDIY